MYGPPRYGVLVTIIHIALASDWELAVEAGTYRKSTRDLMLDDVGFIHCSTPAQLAGVVTRFYAEVTQPLRVLEMDAAAVRAAGTKVVFEGGGNGDLFPHIYGAIDPAWVSKETPAHIVDGLLVLD